jgi:hypothetical protein
MYTITGMGAAAVAFIVVAVAWDQLMEHSPMSFVAGAVAAFFAYQHFKKKDDQELEKILHPPAEVWPVPLPIAWGAIKDVLDSSMVVTGQGSPSKWHVTKEDDSRGIITAQLNFNQQLGTATNPKLEPRTIVCDVQFTPEGSTTKVNITYQTVSPSGAGMVKSIIDQTQKGFTASMNANKGSV